MLPTEEDKAKLVASDEENETDDQPEERPSNFGDNLLNRIKNRSNNKSKTNTREIANKIESAEKIGKTAKNAKTVALLLNPEIWIGIGIAALIILIIFTIVIVFANLAKDPSDAGQSPAQPVNTENTLDQKELKLLQALNSSSNSEETVQLIIDNKNVLNHIASILAEQRIDIDKIPDSIPPKANKKTILDEITKRISDNLNTLNAKLSTASKNSIFTSLKNDFKTLNDYATKYPKNN